MDDPGLHHQKVPPMELDFLVAGELVGRGPFQQEEQLETLVRMPGHPAGHVAVNSADMNQHRQLELITEHVDRFLVHAMTR